MKKASPNPYMRKPDHPNYLRRSSHHDYNRPARYMITLMSADHVGKLSIIQGDLSCISSSGYPHSVATPAGECFHRALRQWLLKFPEIEVSEHEVMPDHVHLCVDVRFYLKNGLSRAVASLMGMTTNEHKSLLRADHNQDPQIASDKHASFFKKGFNDRIAYSSSQWERQKRYVRDNPRRYLMKKKYPDLFYMRWLITIGDCRYVTKGNIHLLKNPDIQVVRFSRKYMKGEFERKEEEWKRCVFNNGALVSPFIHPKEKDMRKFALNEGGSIIRICENGFAERFSPQGLEFDYNSYGQLLLIAPIEHNTRKEDLTYTKAQYLNKIAEQIAATDWLSGQGRISPLP